MTKDKHNPLFCHFKKDWHRDFMETSFSLVAHAAFEEEAKLKNYLIEKYGKGILEVFTNGMTGLHNPYPA